MSYKINLKRIFAKINVMQYLLYLILYPILWIISILPFRLLYLFSDFVYLLVYHIIRYRRVTVKENLALAFPNLPEKERLIIEKKSYHHLCDMYLETIKTMSISKKEINKRYVFTNLDTYLEIEKKGKSIALMCAHYSSYEWAVSMNHHITFKGYGIYKKISNPYFDKLIKHIRSKFKAYLISTKETKSTIEENSRNGILGIYGFISDQTPRKSDNMYWYSFLGIETPIHFGAEKLAKQYDMNVVFLKGKKIKRGYYEATLELLSDDAKSVPDYKISEDFIQRVEKQIYESPEYYLWTHKRWKHKK